MKLEKAIERLSEFANMGSLDGRILGITENQYHDIKESINTALQHIKHLQKENEKYISGELMTRNQAKHFEEINKKYYIHKDKIREKIEELEENLKDFEQTDNTGRFSREKSRDYDKKEVLENLLKEE